MTVKPESFFPLQFIVFVVAIIPLFYSSNSSAQQINEMRVITKMGDWELRQSKDSFTDKESCVITNSANGFVQVNIDLFYISYRGRGGIQGYKYRIDNETPSDIQLLPQIHKRIGIIEIKGQLFDRILRANRLRIQSVTLISGLLSEDIDLHGLNAVYNQMATQCGAKSNTGSAKLDKKPNPAKVTKHDSSPEPKTGKSQFIQQMQTRLNRLGYDVGTPDGVIGPKTRDALLKYAQSAGLDAAILVGIMASDEGAYEKTLQHLSKLDRQ